MLRQLSENTGTAAPCGQILTQRTPETVRKAQSTSRTVQKAPFPESFCATAETHLPSISSCLDMNIIKDTDRHIVVGETDNSPSRLQHIDSSGRSRKRARQLQFSRNSAAPTQGVQADSSAASPTASRPLSPSSAAGASSHQDVPGVNPPPFP
mmetsp:Transcript_527/g.1115  ORF Transcript_527/g.1115 Transcript_527/m.1115 type:complete len:153 (+) Transcript_527:62-520(+)